MTDIEHRNSYDEEASLEMEESSEESMRNPLLPHSRPSNDGTVGLDEKAGSSGRATGEPVIENEQNVSTSRKLTFLALWFALNLSLTLYNKAILMKFPYPWLLTTVHSTFATFGCGVLWMCSWFKLKTISWANHSILILFSCLFTMNIAVSNISLEAVSVPFHQTMRSLCPLITVIIYKIVFSRTYSTATYASLVPIVLGVALATYGDYLYTSMGLFLTLLGVFLASLKTIATNKILTGDLAMPALELLLRMSPLAAVQSLICSYLNGELDALLSSTSNIDFPMWSLIGVAGNGMVAFLLNVASLSTNKVAGALTLTVAGNIKQCLTIIIGIACFNVPVSALNGIGMLVTFTGGAIYSKVELDSKVR